MNLYQIDQAILDCIDADTGEVIDFDKISQLMLDKEKKIDDLACFYKQLAAEATAIDFEIKALQGRKKVKESKVADLKNYLSDVLSGQKFETARNRITWLPSDEVNILDADLIPDAYKKEEIQMKISKTDIKTAIKAGLTVDGAELIYKSNIQIK